MSHRNAKKLRKALFKKGIATTNNKNHAIQHGNGAVTVLSNTPRRVYKALKKIRPRTEAFKKIAALQDPRGEMTPV